ncbi:aminotransferase class I/II-fold pyridoxal phosphate-dependent enzyme, partial [Streptococcus thermophilus]|nr:aminotransferase class I/II-fold pyridoxal phosphate-dependent enzyme [Streptococcus thermophilus]
MTRYDFTTQPNRLNQNTMKWHEAESDPELLELWVADMDFLPVPEIRDAVINYVETHIFGYPYPSDELYQSIIDWEKNQHGYSVDKASIVLIEGVVPAISTAIQAFTKEDDAVLINTPVYPPFARSVRLNNRKLIENSLVKVNGHFEIDFEQLERDIVDNDVKLYVFCSPHNPGGRVWTKEELTMVADLCQKHGVLLVSDEIHQDLALYGNKHISLNTISNAYKDFTLVLSSATKTFNIAGTKNSFTIIENEDLRKSFKQKQLANNQHEIPTIGLITTQAAFTYGQPWLEELKTVLETNIDLLTKELSEKTNIEV